jgi:hypothetical protein
VIGYCICDTDSLNDLYQALKTFSKGYLPAAAMVTEDDASVKGVLLKRKDFVGLDENALSHPNRTYYFR